MTAEHETVQKTGQDEVQRVREHVERIRQQIRLVMQHASETDIRPEQRHAA